MPYDKSSRFQSDHTEATTPCITRQERAAFLSTKGVPFRAANDNHKQCPDGHEPLSCDILLFSASAAVGKSTFAKALSATSGVPLLDLSKVLVSTDSLRGIISAEMGDMAPGNFQHGQFSLVIDALDEGRIVSGDNNFYEFLCTTIQFLQECPGAKSTGPKLLLLGGPRPSTSCGLFLSQRLGKSQWQI